ncbi:MAG: hypothetical protein KBD50_01815 [Candidatus Pacebacteria bacterium]|nr:hypothetical protein [Candidatus Paceibacterota bacterium]
MVSTRVSPAQLLTLTKLKVLMAESGYAIIDVPEHFRRHARDFLAYQPDRFVKFLVVRPTRCNRISISSTLIQSLFNQLPKDILGRQDEFLVKVTWHFVPHAKWSSYTPPPQIHYGKR